MAFYLRASGGDVRTTPRSGVLPPDPGRSGPAAVQLQAARAPAELGLGSEQQETFEPQLVRALGGDGRPQLVVRDRCKTVLEELEQLDALDL